MGGACGTCKAKIVEGHAEMDQNFAAQQGRTSMPATILTCQAHPTSSTVMLDYDA